MTTQNLTKLETIEHFLSIFETGQQHTPVFLDPLMASNIVIKFNYSNQRPVNAKKVSRYAAFIKNGSFRENTSIDFCVLDGEPHLVNGQHTLMAISESKVPFPITFNIHYVHTIKDIEKIYSTFDPAGAARTLNQVLGNIGNEIGITKKHDLRALGVAVKHIYADFANGNCIDTAKAHDLADHEIVKDLMREWAVEARHFFSDVNSGGQAADVFLRGAIVAVGLITYKYQPKMAIDFWKQAAMDDGLRKKDPRKTFFNWCQRNTTKNKQFVQHRAAIAAWNAFFEGKALTKIYTTPEKSAVILGTPIDLRRTMSQETQKEFDIGD